jgi:peptidoglycan/LPS O-acetylase OafA/YrhL
MSDIPQSIQNGKSARIRGLDGLRALSMALVLVQHGRASFSTEYAPIRFLVDLLANGTLGVTTFFVISGYLITYLLRKEFTQTGRISLSAFYIRRALRIFPALYVYLAVIALLRCAGVLETTPGDFLVAGCFLSNYRHAFLDPVTDATMNGFWFLGHFWTLALEEQFYLLWPFAVVLAGPTRAPRVSLAIIALAPLLRVMTYFAWPASRGQLGGMVHCAGDSLMFGCLLALWQGRPGFDNFAKRYHHWTMPLTALVFLLVVSPELGQRFRGSYSMTMGISLNSLAITSILIWIVSHQDGALVRGLEWAPLKGLGVLSYSVYLWQQLVLAPSNSTWTAKFPVNMILCVVLGWLSFRCVETPFLRLRDRYRAVTTSRPLEISGHPGG